MVSVGELNANKNHSVMIRALGMLDDLAIHYAIAGKGEAERTLIAVAKECGVDERVHLLGYRDDVPDIYAAADVCVFPSIREGLGLAAVEGMASGLPLIVSDNRGTRVFVKAENGITCGHKDAMAFADAIVRLKNDPALCRQMGECNKEASKTFEVGQITRKMLEVYREI